MGDRATETHGGPREQSQTGKDQEVWDESKFCGDRAPEIKRDPDTDRIKEKKADAEKTKRRNAEGKSSAGREGERETVIQAYTWRKKDSERDVGLKKERQADVSRPS